jgi:hypothetical protein
LPMSVPAPVTKNAAMRNAIPLRGLAPQPIPPIPEP